MLELIYRPFDILISLPVYPELSPEQIEEVVDEIKKFLYSGDTSYLVKE